MEECPLAQTGSGKPESGEAALARVYRRLKPRTRMSLREKAAAFLDLLELEEGAPGVESGRRAEVLRDVERHGFYEHTPEELQWGCRLAWRHSVRCVGRFFWRQLEVRDARGEESVEAVAGRCIEHLRDATNGGAVRSLVTVFAPQRGRRAFRVWNYQLARYAGYGAADGGVLGDPAEAEFTRRCMELGWRPPAERGPFDLLPLVVSGPGGAVEWTSLPRESVLEVALSHPELEGFAGLGLRWYAVPVVSNMLLEIGGIRYPAAPFNGWYMGTEVGARNLADVGRYDMLPEVAHLMGLSTRKEATLWRDRALVELNRAVLHSYQSAGVRMIDHHAAAQLHVRFEEEEAAAGRPVTGLWDWLVPPLSGATSPLWSRRYDPTEYSPNFRYQPRAW